MHELGIVMQVIDQVEQVAAENHVTQVVKLNMEVGQVSSVVPDLFADCFEWAKKKTKYLQETQLEMVILEGISYCQDCRQTYRTTVSGRTCPHCGSEHTYLVTGNEVNIKDIEVLYETPALETASPEADCGAASNQNTVPQNSDTELA